MIVSACACVCMYVSGASAPSFPGRDQTSCLLLQPLFKRLTQTRWAAPAQILEEIIATVGERLPESLELHNCFREVRRGWAEGWSWQGSQGSSLYAHANTHMQRATHTCTPWLWHLPLPGSLALWL